MSADVYSIVTGRMIALLKAGTAPWRKTWRGGDSPRNLISKKPYRGVNTLLLGSTSFASPYWLTFNQVQQLNGRVKKGAKSELVIFWKFFDSQKETDEGSSSEQTAKRRPPLLRYYRVFNVEQTEGLEKYLPPPPSQGLVCLLVKINSLIEITGYDPSPIGHLFVTSPNIVSGAADCGNPTRCPLVMTVESDR